MRTIQNSVEATITLQDTFTAQQTSPMKRICFNSYDIAYEIRRENNSLVDTYDTRFDAEEAYLCETYPDTYYSGKKYKVIYNNDKETVKSVATFEA